MLKKVITVICMPLVLFGAINYGLIGIFHLDLLGYVYQYAGAIWVQVAQIIIGAAGLGLATGLVQK
ncbi:MAG: DUF378 domain-containing protein [Rickettsiales bacterium]|jgi:uncharacterized membrane protein YuzA (DUF378 family)|nr:DUF378 domain-containing protein [Rickettsiales bacterium]